MSDSQNAGSTFGLGNYGENASVFGATQLPDILGLAQSKLQQAAASPDLFVQVFGDKANMEEIQAVRLQWSVGGFSQLPSVQVLSADSMNGAFGAYASSTQTVYLSDSLFQANAAPTDSLLGVVGILVEETFHWLDDRVGTDTQGDEGELSRNLVFGNSLGNADLTRIQSVNDSGFITVYGQSLAAEFSSNSFTYGGKTYQWTNYTIRSGDSLSAIAQRTLGDGSANGFNFIAQRNGIPNPSKINVNQVIQVPQLFTFVNPTPTSTPSPATSPTPQTGNFTYGGKTYQWTNYTIRAGDSLSAIAQRTLGDGSANGFNFIAQRNSISNPSRINVNQVIQVPQLFTVVNLAPNPSPTPTGYYRELNTFSESLWDQQSGDDNQFRPDSPFGGGDQRGKTDDRIEQIYTDLSNSVFGYRVQMTAGYAYDQSYFNGFRKWHAGLDMGASNGATIKAAIGGSVAWVSGSGDGNIFVGINSDDGRQWVYGHLKSTSGLSVGRRINAGAAVGVIGAQNHLHLEVQNGQAYGGTNGAMTDRNRLLSVTVSPLMAYWQWRNKVGTVVNPPANNPVVTPPTNNVPRVSSTNWKAEFFNNLSLAGGPVLTQDLGSGNQNFSRNWGYGSPGSAVSSDNFSARVTTQRYFAPGTYQIQTTSDDGVRVRIGNQTVINKWVDQASNSHFGTFTTTGGTFNVSIEYYERGGAANLSFGTLFTPIDNAGNSRSSARFVNLGSSTTHNFQDWVGNTDANDYYSFYFNGTRNLRLNLTGLNADADVEVLNSSGTVVGSSRLGGTRSETIDINNLGTGTYYARVYASNGVNTSYNLSLRGEIPNSVKTSVGFTKDGVERHVTLERVQSPGYIENKPTWLVIHGLNGKAEDFRDLAGAIEEYDGIWSGGDYQVLTVDWSGARVGGSVEYTNAAASWIDTVAESVKNTIRSWGIASSNINLVGHSLGAYVAYEISERLGGVNKLVALNPASTTFGGYNESQVDFSRHSNWSWAFWHNNNHVTDNAERSLTADESFKVTLTGQNWDVNKGHGSAKLLWTNMLKNKSGSVSQWFGIDDIRSRTAPWYIGSGWEAEIEVNAEFKPTGRVWDA